MNVIKMVAELRTEREQIEEAILTLERLARGRSKRRGRPPNWMLAAKKRGRRPRVQVKAKTRQKISAPKGRKLQVKAKGRTQTGIKSSVHPGARPGGNSHAAEFQPMQ